MDLYNKWLEEEDYSEGVELVALYAPDHPLLPMLQEGETPLNRIYLSGILPDIQPPKKEPAVTTAISAPSRLYLRQRELLKGRAITRNQYHDYALRNDVPAVQARLRINRELIDIRKELQVVSRRIEHYEKTGELITVPNVAAVCSPMEQAGTKALLNARSNVSRWKRKLKKLYHQQATKEKIQAAELKVKHYETIRDLLEQKLTKHE